MTVEAIKPVTWVDSNPVVGAVDTPSEAITSWMNSEGITDVTKMTPAQFRELITYLKNLNETTPIAGLDRLITSLEAAMTNNKVSAGTPLEQLSADLKLRSAMLTELGRALGGESNPFSLAAKEIDDLVGDVDDLIKKLSDDLTRWSEDPAELKTQIQALIDSCTNLEQALKDSGISVDGLGLGTLRTSLQNALTAFEEAMKGTTGPDDMKAKLAVSNLREAFFQSRIDYLKSTGAASNGSELVSAQADLRSEQLRQTALLTPAEDTTATPRAVTVEEIDAAMEELDLQYQVAASEGDKDAMAHISSKMQILERAREGLLNGRDPFLVGLVLFVELRSLDIVSKKVLQSRLREEVSKLQAKNDPADAAQIQQMIAQADGLEVEIDALTKQVSQFQDQYESALATWTQNVNEALSKAF